MSDLAVNVEYSDNVRFVASTRTHIVVCDQPPEHGGTDEGMTPPELLLASLGTCAAYYAVQYLKIRKLPATGVRVAVSAEKTKNPARIGSFVIDVNIPGDVPEHHVAGVSRAVHSCLIHNTLLHAPSIAIAIHAGQETNATPA